MSAETELYEELLCGHMSGMVYRLRRIPSERFDETFAPPAPTPRQLAVHAWSWLQSDRAHIEEPDAAKHPRLSEPPESPAALCDALAVETENWRTLLRSLTPEQLDEARFQFNQPGARMTVRQFVGHILQNNIYKHGQFAALYFAGGYDGTEPYTAPLPNPIYAELFDTEETV